VDKAVDNDKAKGFVFSAAQHNSSANESEQP